VPKLPVVSGVDVIKGLAKIGYELDHQTGSHMILRQREPPHRRITVPRHREIAKGTLRAIIRETGLTVEEFLRLL
jgi:predicted RNA binding protein YcfA (HicA-like mRNA interferase family)